MCISAFGDDRLRISIGINIMKNGLPSMEGDRVPPLKHGLLALASGSYFELQVCKSQAGHYIGTLDVNGEPYTRESQEYWVDRVQAEIALRDGRWTQKPSL
jgi:hypothetical protein